jgi:hypothetical protein
MKTKNRNKTRKSRTSDGNRQVRSSDMLSQAEVKAATLIVDIPDVVDIPGQEHITPPPLGELADTTISSADEEGEGLWNDEILLGGEG